MACDSIEEERKCENFVIDIPSEQSPLEWPQCCIYRVPKQLRKVNKGAYTPKLISIGPIHHGRKELSDMEMHKWRYFRDFFELRKLKKSENAEKDLANIIKDNETRIRHCYSNYCRLNSKDFVTMILLDAIFIIELFLKVRDCINGKDDEEANRKRKKREEEDEEEDQRKGKEKEESEDEEEAQSERKKGEEEDEADEEEDQRKGTEKEKKDYILRKPWLDLGISNDLILLENQLPFFVLENLYEAAFYDSSNLSQHHEGQEIQEHEGDLSCCPFLQLSRDYFNCHQGKQMPNINGKVVVQHFTDLVRYYFYSPKLKHTGPWEHLCSATELDKAGLKFKADNERQLLDIRFPESKCLNYWPCFNLWLEVPCFAVDDNTECLFRNLMALEQCHYPFNAYVCNYVSLLDDLINNEKDAALLVDKNVIVNHLGSNTAVATLINELCNQIVFANSYYSDLYRDIKNYRDNPWNGIVATMKRVYFSDFWRGAATVVGLVVLVLTLWNFLAPLASTTILRLGSLFPFFF